MSFDRRAVHSHQWQRGQWCGIWNNWSQVSLFPSSHRSVGVVPSTKHRRHANAVGVWTCFLATGTRNIAKFADKVVRLQHHVAGFAAGDSVSATVAALPKGGFAFAKDTVSVRGVWLYFFFWLFQETRTPFIRTQRSIRNLHVTRITDFLFLRLTCFFLRNLFCTAETPPIRTQLSSYIWQVYATYVTDSFGVFRVEETRF